MTSAIFLFNYKSELVHSLIHSALLVGRRYSPHLSYTPNVSTNSIKKTAGGFETRVGFCLYLYSLLFQPFRVCHANMDPLGHWSRDFIGLPVSAPILGPMHAGSCSVPLACWGASGCFLTGQDLLAAPIYRELLGVVVGMAANPIGNIGNVPDCISSCLVTFCLLVGCMKYHIQAFHVVAFLASKVILRDNSMNKQGPCVYLITHV